MEQGTHHELIRRGGLYARLYEEQFEGGHIECLCEDGVVLSDGTIAQHKDRTLEPAMTGA